MRDECEHGHLRRSCDMCNVIADHVREITEKNAEIAELRYSLSQAHSVAQACAARAERAEANAANWEEQANDRVSDWDEVRAERDALRALLKDAREGVDMIGCSSEGYDSAQLAAERARAERCRNGVVEACVEYPNVGKYIAQVEAERDAALAWTDQDESLPEDDAIRAAHPLATKRHDLYMEAMRLVGAKRSKGALVDLVNWLLAERNALRAALAAAGVEEMVREAVRKTADAAFVALGETTETRIVNEVMGK